MAGRGRLQGVEVSTAQESEAAVAHGAVVQADLLKFGAVFAK